VPGDAWAFYVNDFGLTDPLPWRVPTRLELITHRDEGSEVSLELDWREPQKGAFYEVFSEIMQRIESTELRKAVPAVTARAAWSEEHEKAFLGQWPTLGGEAGTHGYAYRSADGSGCAGQTPEVLFHLENGVLKTMALAGTSPSESAAAMLETPKLLREHELVAEMLRERLAALGDLVMEPRGLLSLGAMSHLCTRLSVTLDEPDQAGLGDALIRLLHPTPALGIAPRTAATLEMLREYRERLGVPPMFGAPFGIHWPQGMLMLVAIRGIFWKRDEVLLPAGVGLVAGSDFEMEWAELELKRAWVRHALRV
jgi:menaquinone-specific isochorismate synthase